MSDVCKTTILTIRHFIKMLSFSLSKLPIKTIQKFMQDQLLSIKITEVFNKNRKVYISRY